MSQCPICKRPTNPEYRPFCCRRCADVDLGRWFNGDYRVPSFRLEDEETEIESKTSSTHLDPDDSIR
ncbi:DNA gyrase inhibitor YacG [Kozakia baliensis]|uniref:DNA gyrase inhibitor YacG n=1 Tax=Kozakia baliensis TaxID=153496 RepID=UPI0009E04BEC|nr:DNA gyrase inhibitor YacG [Kozakia baliensis]